MQRGWAFAFVTAFILFAAHYLIAENSDTLFMAQSRSLFYNSGIHFKECMQLPAGLLSFTGGFLTQFFYFPALGAAILIFLWIAIALITKKAFNIRNLLMPLTLVAPFMLLISVIDLGYWLYYIKFIGYFFVPTLGLLLVVSWAALRLPKKGLWTVILALTYPFFGIYSLISMAITGLQGVKGKNGNDEKIHSLQGKWYLINVAFPFVLAFITPILWFRAYSELAIENAWISGFPIFEAEEASSWILSMPFIIAIVWLFILAIPKPAKWTNLVADKLSSNRLSLLCSTIIFVALAFITHKANFDNYNYHAEMRMYNAAEDYDWDKILLESAKLPGDATREMVILKNIALFNKGTVGTQFFHYNNMGEKPYVRDSLKVHMVQTAAPLLYMFHGKVNFSTRWCIENSVEYGYSYNNLRILAICALVNEEYKLARKYLDILSNTLFQKKWAEHYMPATSKTYMLNQNNIQKYYPELANIIDLQRHMGSVLDGDNGIPEMYLINYFSRSLNKDSKYFQEMTLVYALVQKDIQLFWPRFIQYAYLNSDKTMPIHYQEAAYLYGKLEPQSMDISRMPFDQQQIVARYERFNQTAQSLLNSGLDTKQVGETMKAAYGDTFWWFYFFCRDITSY